jgi:hypothetical protein
MIVEPRPRASAAPPKAKPAPTHSKDIDELVARNMFCSDCEARTDVPAAAAPPPALATLTLIATMRDDSGWSATIRNPTTARAGSYRVGEVVPDVGPVRRIGPQSIDVENVAVARVERVHLFPPAPSAAAPPPPGDPRVRRVADNRFEVDRAVVDEMLSNPMAARGSARVFPAVENGRPVGFRVSNLRGSSVLSKMGLEDGDQVRAVNGYTLDSPDHALEAYSKLRDAKQFQVAVLRRGRPVNLEYTIR